MQGLINLVGLTIDAPRPRGGFSYTHPATGFVFEIVHDESESEDEEGSLVFNPLDFGSAEEVPISILVFVILQSSRWLKGENSWQSCHN